MGRWSTDCDDTGPSVHPGAQERCDGIDNDCDGLVDDADQLVAGKSTWYADADADGFGHPGTSVEACDAPAGHVAVADDCDDADATVFPGALELCLDGIDQDCGGGTNDFTGACDPGWLPPATGEGCAGAVAVADGTLCVEGVAALIGANAFATVQEAATALADGETLTVCPGRHEENVALWARDVAVVGHGVGTTILAAGSGPVFTIGAGSRVSLHALSIEAGVTREGAGVMVELADACLDTVTITGGNADYQGGGVAFSGEGKSSLHGSVVYRNRASDGGGGLVVDGDHALDVRDSVVAYNEGGLEGGGGIKAGGWGPATLGLDNLLLVGNRSDGNGGACDVSALEIGAWSFTALDAQENVAAGDGGAIAVSGSEPYELSIADSTFSANEAGNAGGAMALGGDEDHVLALVRVDVLGNLAGSGAGLVGSGRGNNTLRVEGGRFAFNDGGAITLTSWGSYEASFSEVRIEGNTSDQSAALAVGAMEGTTISFDRCTITDNVAARFGGVSGASGTEVSTWTFTDSEVLRNADIDGYGAIWIRDETTVTSLLTDWGEGADDNTPSDFGTVNYDGVATFTCTETACQ